MFRVITMAVSACVVLATGSALLAQQDTPGQTTPARNRANQHRAERSAIQGTIQKIDAEGHTLTLRMADGQDKEFRVTEQTKFRSPNPESAPARDEQGKRGRLRWMASLKPGTKVILMMNPADQGGTVQEVLLGDRPNQHRPDTGASMKRREGDTRPEKGPEDK